MYRVDIEQLIDYVFKLDSSLTGREGLLSQKDKITITEVYHKLLVTINYYRGADVCAAY